MAVLVVGVGQIFAQDKNKEKITRPEVKKEWMDLPMKKWEYKVVHVERDQAKMEEALNKLGEQGWEYVGTVSWVGAVRSGAANPPIHTEAYFICKRPK